MCNLFAIGADGVKKWEFRIEIPVGGFKTPAIGPDGTIYVVGDSLYAINPDGSRQWAYLQDQTRGSRTGDLATSSTPTVASDGTIYIVLHPELRLDLVALHPDGTEKWISSFTESYYISGSITIDSDGTLYFPGETGGEEEHYFYAVHPDGSLK